MKKVAALLLLVGTAFASSAFTGCETGPSSCELAQIEASKCSDPEGGIPGGGACNEDDSEHACIARCISLVAIQPDPDPEREVDCTRLYDRAGAGQPLAGLLPLIAQSAPEVDDNRLDLDLVFEDIDRLKASFAGEFPDAGPDADPDELEATRPIEVDQDLEVCIANCWI